MPKVRLLATTERVADAFGPKRHVVRDAWTAPELSWTSTVRDQAPRRRLSPRLDVAPVPVVPGLVGRLAPLVPVIVTGSPSQPPTTTRNATVTVRRTFVEQRSRSVEGRIATRLMA